MLDWVHLQTFLAVARQGSLSGAAQALGLTQSTMGRRLDALQKQAGATLLNKTSAGFVLTDAGRHIYAAVERMEAEALLVERSIAGRDELVSGEVRVTTVEAFGAQVVTPMLAALIEKQPSLQIELITDYRLLSLSRREADVAIRLGEFQQHEVLVTRVGTMTFGLFASVGYLAERGAPSFDDGAAGHSLVTCQQDLALAAEAQRLMEIAARAAVSMRANSRYVQLQATLAGCGLALLPWYLAIDNADLVELQAPGGRVTRGLWLGVHQDSRNILRVRAVVDHLTASIRDWADRFEPGR